MQRSDRRDDAEDVVVAGRGPVPQDLAVGVHLGDRPVWAVVVQAAPHAVAGDATGDGRAADGHVEGEVRSNEVQGRDAEATGDGVPGVVGGPVVDAAAAGEAAVAARAPGPAQGQVGVDGGVDEFEGRFLSG